MQMRVVRFAQYLTVLAVICSSVFIFHYKFVFNLDAGNSVQSDGISIEKSVRPSFNDYHRSTFQFFHEDISPAAGALIAAEKAAKESKAIPQPQEKKKKVEQPPPPPPAPAKQQQQEQELKQATAEVTTTAAAQIKKQVKEKANDAPLEFLSLPPAATKKQAAAAVVAADKDTGSNSKGSKDKSNTASASTTSSASSFGASLSSTNSQQKKATAAAAPLASSLADEVATAAAASTTAATTTASITALQQPKQPATTAAATATKPATTTATMQRMFEQTLSFLDTSIHKKQKKTVKETETAANKPAEQQKPLKVINKAATQQKAEQPLQPQQQPHLSFLDIQQPDHAKQHPDKHTSSSSSSSSSKHHQPASLQVIHDLNKADADTPEQLALAGHPQTSPRLGTDISPEYHISLLLCPNQSKCLIPELQLTKKLKIYFCQHLTKRGVRFYYLTREGLLLHPNVQLVKEEEMLTADFILYLPASTPWEKSECSHLPNNGSYSKQFVQKLIVLDEYDGPTLFAPTGSPEEHTAKYGGPSAPWYFLYFKRSFVRRTDGKFIGFPHLKSTITTDVYPITYSLAEAYINPHFNMQREIEIMCSLRGNKHMTTRQRVQDWVSEYGVTKKVKNIIAGEVDGQQRTTISQRYFQQLYNAQIIVTVNPANWEGDFRLWESMVSGALVFVDPLFVPHPFPLLDKVHVIFFSNQDKDDLWQKLDYYRAHPLERKKIAIQGYLHAMKYHRTVNMIDYVLRTAHIKQSTLIEHDQKLWPISAYTYTGQYLNYEAKLQEHMMKTCDLPGIYKPAVKPGEAVKRLETCPDRQHFTLHR